MAEMHSEVTVHAPIEAVWERYNDHPNACDWLPLSSAVLTRPGRDEPNGLGAVRTFKRQGLSLVEEVITWQPPHYMEYRLIGGVPFLKNHLGRARFVDSGGAVRLTWDVTLEFKPLSPTWLLTRVITGALEKRFQGGLERLKELLERDAS